MGRKLGGLQRALVVALALLVATAGCIGTDRSGSEMGDEADEGDAGEEEQLEGSATEQDPPESVPEPEPVWVEIEEEGNYGTGTTTCAAAVVGVGCSGIYVIGSERGFVLDEGAEVGTVQVEMTWDALSPAMEELRLGVSWDCDDGGCDDWSYVDGTSPLSLEVTEVEDREPILWAWIPATVEDPLWTYVTHEQPFTIEGQMSLLP